MALYNTVGFSVL